jgi:hypothetical protein
MPAADTLEYINPITLRKLLAKELVAEFTDGSFTVPQSLFRGIGRNRNKLCMKHSATAPTTTDFANAIGDICLHFNAAGTFVEAYVATAMNISTSTHLTDSTTWTALAVTHT